MHLNAELLYEELSKTFSLNKTGPVIKEEHLRRPVLYYQDMLFLPDYIYIADAINLPSDRIPPAKCCIISVGKPPDSYLNSHANIIYTEQNTEPGLILNQVQAIFDLFDDWDKALNKLIIDNAELQELLDISQPFFGSNFLIILNMNYRVLATTAERDFVMNESGHTPARALTRFKSDPEYVKMRFCKETFLYKGKYTQHDILSHHIYTGDKLWGGVSLAAKGEPITNGRWTLFEHLVDAVKRYQKQHIYLYSKGELPVLKIISQMLNDGKVSDRELSNLKEKIGWGKNPEYLACYISLQEMDKRISTAPYLCNQIESLLVYALAFEYDTDIVVVINNSKAGPGSAFTSEEFQNFLKDSMLQAGISRPFRDIKSLKNYYMQAVAALDLGKFHKPEKTIFHFHDYALEYMLEKSSGSISIESLCPEGLLRLREMDENRSTSYIKTLNTYFNTCFNASRSAKDLFISRSTFLDRMDRIKKTLQMDLDDPDMRLYLNLCLRLLNTIPSLPSKNS